MEIFANIYRDAQDLLRADAADQVGEGLSSPAAQVTLRLRGRQVKATVALNSDDVEQIAPVLTEHLRDKPTDASIHNVTYDDTGEPVADKVRRVAGNVRMVWFKLA